MKTQFYRSLRHAIGLVILALFFIGLIAGLPASNAQTNLTREAILNNGVDSIMELAAWEMEYFENTGEYGDFDDLMDAGFIEEALSLDNYIDGYDLYWYMGRDDSDFMVVALPTDDADLLGIMIDSRDVVFSIFTSDYNDSDEYSELIQMEEATLIQVGYYVFIDLSQFYASDILTGLFLGSDQLSFAVWSSWTGNDGITTGEIYLSDTQLTYAFTTHDPSLGPTVTGVVEYWMLVASMSRVKGMLKSLGSVQLGFQSINDEKKCGTFQELVDTHFIPEGHTPENMVENYHLYFTTNYEKDGFSVVAIPTEENEVLEIFMIDESQIVTRLVPSDIDSFYSVWDEIIEFENEAWDDTGKYMWVDYEEMVPDRNLTEVYINDEMDSYVISCPFDPSRSFPCHVYFSTTGRYYEKRLVN